MSFYLGHVDDCSVVHITLYDPIVCLADLLRLDHLDLAQYIVLAAEVEHLLGFLNTANQRACDCLATENERHAGKLKGLWRRADNNHLSMALKHVCVGVDIVLCGYGVDNHVKVFSRSLNLIRITHVDEVVGFKVLDASLLFLVVSGNHSNVASHCFADLDCHVTKATHSNNTQSHVRLKAVLDHWGVDSDSSAEKRRSGRKVQVQRDFESELFFCHDVLSVATLGNMSFRSLVFLSQEFCAVSKDTLACSTELLFVHGALVTCAAGVNHAADTSVIANLEVLHIRANSYDNSSNFVTRSQGVNLGAPLTANCVDV